MNNYKAAVIGGGGHIGLPMSCFLQNSGVETLIIDKNNSVLRQIENIDPPFKEINFEHNLKNAIKSGLKTTSDIKKIKGHNVIIICLGTSSKLIDKELFNQVISDITNYIEENSLLILRSTIEKGLVEKIIKNFNKLNKNIKVAYCPERIAEGFAFEELQTLPQIVGTVSNEEYEVFAKFFDYIEIDTIGTTIQEAEFIKLFLNTYRYSQFSLLNYFSNIANDNLLDFHKILKIAKFEYPRLKGVPSPGFVGGPCLIKDSKTFIESYGDDHEVLESLINVNNKFMKNLIKKIKTNFKGNKILQLGLTFKPNSDDLRDSQALVLYEALLEEGYEIVIVEPNIENYDNYEDVVGFSNNVLIATFHDEFKKIDFSSKEVIFVGDK